VKNSLDPDEQLLDRRRVEYDIFLLVEELHVLDIIRKDLALWMNLLRWPILSAIAVNPEPGSRWNCTEHLFIEHGLRHFATQAITEGNKKPDFLFLPQGLTTILSFP
jgi:hypothetical protein